MGAVAAEPCVELGFGGVDGGGTLVSFPVIEVVGGGAFRARWWVARWRGHRAGGDLAGGAGGAGLDSFWRLRKAKE
jgi:hypothetical protein